MVEDARGHRPIFAAGVRNGSESSLAQSLVGGIVRRQPINLALRLLDHMRHANLCKELAGLQQVLARGVEMAAPDEAGAAPVVGAEPDDPMIADEQRRPARR